MIETLLSSYRSIIVLNGKKLSKTLLQMIRENVPIIAADGAAQWIQPNYIVGDIDSLSTVPNHAQVISISDQETTDFEKCMKFAEGKDLLPSLVMGVSGGEIDHVLGNIQTLIKHTKDLSFFFLDDYQDGLKIGIPLSNGKYHTKVKPNAVISILPYCSCTLTTRGLNWELENQVISTDGLQAIRNRAINTLVEFELAHGKALIIIDI